MQTLAFLPHYWILDVAEPVSLVACHIAGDFGYQDSGEITGVLDVEEPFPFLIDLDTLV